MTLRNPFSICLFYFIASDLIPNREHVNSYRSYIQMSFLIKLHAVGFFLTLYERSETNFKIIHFGLALFCSQSIHSLKQHRNQFVKNTLAESTFNCIWRAHLRCHLFAHPYCHTWFSIGSIFATAVCAVHSINKFNDRHTAYCTSWSCYDSVIFFLFV